MKGDPARPPWNAHDRRDCQMMHDWVNARLDEEDEAQARRRIDAILVRLGVPPEKLKSEDDRQANIDSVSARIDEDDETRSEALLIDVPPEHREKYFKWRRGGGLEHAAAEDGVIEPMRALVRSVVPYADDLVQLPKLKPGQKFRRVSLPEAERRGRIAAAARDVKRIRALWRRYYGRHNRHSEDGPSAEEIAAERHGAKTKEWSYF
jgi:hypothetical protein